MLIGLRQSKSFSKTKGAHTHTHTLRKKKKKPIIFYKLFNLLHDFTDVFSSEFGHVLKSSVDLLVSMYFCSVD